MACNLADKVAAGSFSGDPVRVNSNMASGGENVVTNSESETLSITDLPLSLNTTVAATNGLTSEAMSGLRVQASGAKVPHSAIFDLKTRAETRPYEMKEILPRLWVNQTPNFIIGYHNRGIFNDIRKQDVRPEVQRWESDMQPLLQRFHALLKRIIGMAREYEGRKLQVARDGAGDVQIHMHFDQEWTALPADLKLKWMTWEGDDDNRLGVADIEQNAEYVDETSVEPKIRSDIDGPCDEDEDEYEDGEKDYTACSAEDCGYCGRCRY